MRLTVQRDEFKKAFAIAASLLRGRDRTPIPGVFLAPRDGHVLLYSTDRQIVIRTAVLTVRRIAGLQIANVRVPRVTQDATPVSYGIL